MATTSPSPGVTKKYIDDRITDVTKTFIREIASLHETLKQIENERQSNYRELKDIVSCGLLEVETLSDNDKHASAEENNKTANASSGLSSKTSRVHPSETTVTVDRPKFHKAGNFFRRKFKEVAKEVASGRAVTSHVASLKHERPQPKELSTQYDDALEQLYLNEWPDAVPKYESKHRCCHRDPKRDHDSWTMLKQVFPPHLFYFLVLSGAIPHPRSKPCFYATTVWWMLYFCFGTMYIVSALVTSGLHLKCQFDANCQVISKFDISRMIGFMLEMGSMMLSVLLIQTYVRDLLQSRELQTLICSVGPGRIRTPEHGWNGFFAGYCILTATILVWSAVKASTDPTWVIVFFVYLLAVAPLTQVLVFFLVTRAMCLCYDDWTTTMLGATATPKMQHSAESRLIQFNLLQKLKARVSLCAVVTRNTRLLLLPAVLACAGFVFMVLSLVIDPSWDSFNYLSSVFVGTSLPQVIPIAFPLFVSWRMDIFENLVAQADLRKITDYLDHAPKGWMLGHKSALNLDLLARATGSLTVLAAFCTFYVAIIQEASTIPWEDQVKYQHFGTCADGIRSGLEQHMDCGRPESSCPQSCREKYGQYILISADRECGDVDGYVHITTQRACTAAYNTWARLNNRSGTSRHAVVHEGASMSGELGEWSAIMPEVAILQSWEHSTWADGFRCGAYTRPRVNLGLQDVPRFSFPALFSSSKTSSGIQKPLAYLCYAERPRACKSQASESDSSEFEEMISCPGPVRHKWGDSAWRNISGPVPTFATSWGNSSEVAEFRAGRGEEGDCARIQVHNSALIGAQVVFTLACDNSTRVGPRVRSGNTTVRDEHEIICPKDNIVRLSTESGQHIRSTLLVSPTPNMTHMTVYRLELKAYDITVLPDSMLVLVVDKTSDLRNIKLCF